jgi:hypothetical protein
MGSNEIAIVVRMSPDLVFDPEIRLTDGTIIRNREDAIAFARQRVRRDSSESRHIVHSLESARPEEVEAAAQQFRRWVVRLKLVAPRGA